MFEYDYLCFLISLNITVTVLRWAWDAYRSDNGGVSSIEFQYSIELLKKAIIKAIENDNTSDKERREYKRFLKELEQRPNIEVAPRKAGDDEG